MGKVTLVEAKMLPKLVTGAKGIRKRKQLGCIEEHGKCVLCRTGEEGTPKVNARRGKA